MLECTENRKVCNPLGIERMRTICQTCGGDNIHMFKTNTLFSDEEMIFKRDDHFYCADCEDECLIDEIEDSKPEIKSPFWSAP